MKTTTPILDRIINKPKTENEMLAHIAYVKGYKKMAGVIYCPLCSCFIKKTLSICPKCGYDLTA